MQSPSKIEFMNIKLNILLISLVLSTLSLSINAGQLYRFQNDDGVSTISHDMPASAAQKGYDILDDKSLRLIKRVPPALTPEQIAEEKRQISAEKEAQRLAIIAAKEEQKQQQQLAIYDQNLLANYLTEQDLIDRRDSDLTYHQTQIEKATQHLEKSKQNSISLQQQAAEQELAGQELGVKLNKRLQANAEEINNNQAEIERLNLEVLQLTKQYETDLDRLQQLLSKDKH